MIQLFFAGEYSFKFGEGRYYDLFDFGYSRLYSYHYQRKTVDAVIGRMNDKEKFMDLFLVGPEKEVILNTLSKEEHFNMLFSYTAGKSIDKFLKLPKKVFIDSGAFSAWTRGEVIDVDEYIKWINDRSEYISLYGQLDVIPGTRTGGAPTADEVREAAQKTWENYLYMRPKMKNPDGLLYTFHVGEPKEFLVRALEWMDDNGNHIPYIAFGGMVGKSYPVRLAFLTMCYDVIKNSSNPNVKVHAFGMTDKQLLTEFPITSADSTSWIMVGAAGGIASDFGVIPVSSQRSNQKGHYTNVLPGAEEITDLSKIEKYGFTLDELAESRDKRLIHNARYHMDKISQIKRVNVVKRRALF